MKLHPRMLGEIDRLGPTELIRARLELVDLMRREPGAKLPVFHVYTAVTAAIVRRGLMDEAGGLFIGA